MTAAGPPPASASAGASARGKPRVPDERERATMSAEGLAARAAFVAELARDAGELAGRYFTRELDYAAESKGPQDWVSADLGLNWNVGENVTAFAAYSGRFNDDQQERHSGSLGLRVTF